MQEAEASSLGQQEEGGVAGEWPGSRPKWMVSLLPRGLGKPPEPACSAHPNDWDGAPASAPAAPQIAIDPPEQRQSCWRGLWEASR